MMDGFIMLYTERLSKLSSILVVEKIKINFKCLIHTINKLQF